MKIIELPDRPSWLRERNSGCGASDTPIILNENPAAWGSRYDLWCLKVGAYTAEDKNEEWKRHGHELEPYIHSMFERETGLGLIDPGDFTIFRSEDFPWMCSTVDRFIDGDPRGMGVAQIKTVGGAHSHEWNEGIPFYYQLQIQHELIVTGATFGVFPVLLGGPTIAFKLFEVEPNQEIQEIIVKETRAFWELVESETPPEPDERPATRTAIWRRFQSTGEKYADLPAEAEQWDIEREKLIPELNSLQRRKKILDNKIREAIGEAEVGRLDGTPLFRVDKNNKRLYRFDFMD